jgi:hypothetical protein
MARLLRAAIVMACFLSAGSAFAAGGTCSSGANYLNATTGAKVTLASLGVTSCYYISAAGSDSNTGTTTAASGYRFGDYCGNDDHASLHELHGATEVQWRLLWRGLRGIGRRLDGNVSGIVAA